MKALVLTLAVLAVAPIVNAAEHCGGEAYPCTPKVYGVPGWLKDLNAAAKKKGFGPVAEACGAGELYPCEAKVFGIPFLLKELNELGKRLGGRVVDPAETDMPHGP